MREREERERVAQRHVVTVHVVAEGCLVVNEEKKYIDCVITETSPVRERRRGVVTTSGAGVRLGQIQTEEVAVGHRRLREDVLVEVVGSENREHREDILGELACRVVAWRGQVVLVLTPGRNQRDVDGGHAHPVDVELLRILLDLPDSC